MSFVHSVGDMVVEMDRQRQRLVVVQSEMGGAGEDRVRYVRCRRSSSGLLACLLTVVVGNK